MALTKVIGDGLGTTTGNVDFNGDLDVDGTSNLDVVDIDGAVDMASTLTVNDSVTFVSSGSSKPVLTIKNTNADTTPPSITFQKDSSSPADNDEVANINFYGDDDGGSVAAYANLKVVSTDVSNGSEDGKMTIQTMTAGTLTNTLVLESNVATFGASVTAKTDTDTSNSGSVTLDFTANQNFVLTMTGNVTLANPTTEQVGQSGFITFIQDGTGSRVLSVGSQYFCAGGSVIVLSTAANSIDIVPYVVIAAGKICLGAPQLAFADAS